LYIYLEGTEHYLEPRKSFKLWSETVISKSKAWTDEQLETASVLCLVYGKFIEVWRQKEAAQQASQLTNLLLSNAGHEGKNSDTHQKVVPLTFTNSSDTAQCYH
jgi:light-regulated signal transduction histidine kinase (bacteriophytochrome)